VHSLANDEFGLQTVRHGDNIQKSAGVNLVMVSGLASVSQDLRRLIGRQDVPQ